MKDLGSLVQHPSFQGGDSLILTSGQPIILVNNGQKKGFGQPLSNQALMGLLKATLPPDLVSGFQWGREIDYQLETPSGVFPVRIVLKPDKSFYVEIHLSTPPDQEPEEEDEPEAIPVSAPEPGPETQATPPPERPRSQAPEPSADDDVPDTLIEELTSGEGLALVYHLDDRFIPEMEQACVDLGYNPKRTQNVAAVNEVLKYQDYPLLMMQLDEHFHSNPVYQNLINLNMDRRRQQFSVLIAPGLKTADALLAYSLSVNMVVSPDHVTMLFDHLQTGITSWKRFVGTFHDLLKEVGRL